MSKQGKEQAMLNILADVLLLATGQRPDRKQPSLPADADWNTRFISSRQRGQDGQSRRTTPSRDLSW
jgi:hypothetical protein